MTGTASEMPHHASWSKRDSSESVDVESLIAVVESEFVGGGKTGDGRCVVKVTLPFSGRCRGTITAQLQTLTRKSTLTRKTMSFLRAALRTAARPRPLVALPRSGVVMRQSFALQRAWYSAASGLSESDIRARIFDVLKSFEKVDASKVRLLSFHVSHFVSYFFNS